MSASTNVTFVVTNVNEFPPVFTEDVYYAMTVQGSPANSPLLQVLAMDQDRGDSVSYSIVNQPDVSFSVDTNGGISNDNNLIGAPGVCIIIIIVHTAFHGEPLHM